MNMIRGFLVTVLAVPALLFAGERPSPEEFAQSHVIVDTHIDVPYRLQEEWEDVTKATEQGDFDLPRALRGGLDIPFMSIYTPAESEGEGDSFQLVNRLIDSVEAMVGRAAVPPEDGPAGVEVTDSTLDAPAAAVGARERLTRRADPVKAATGPPQRPDGLPRRLGFRAPSELRRDPIVAEFVRV